MSLALTMDHHSLTHLFESSNFCRLSDGQSELITGGRSRGDDDSRHRQSGSGRDKQRGHQGSMPGGCGMPSFGGFMSVNVYQINLAINMIFGGAGNSIFNMQGNQLSGI
jgi:hypothetical protein